MALNGKGSFPAKLTMNYFTTSMHCKPNSSANCVSPIQAHGYF